MDKDSEILELLQRIVTNGRNGRPYKHLLGALKAALKESPEMQKVLRECFKETVSTDNQT